ncbi:MAG: family 10 glycosylhydrolase, partial [Pirellulales bacterium]
MAQKRGEGTAPPPVAREFRGVWVATVENIDWPSRPGLPSDKQQRELIAILDKCVELNLNAVIFQIRTQADALYASKLEPWSEFLSGKMGQPPKPFYDPLEFAVEEAHRRGLQLHAWFNPYRVRVPGAKSAAAANH